MIDIKYARSKIPVSFEDFDKYPRVLGTGVFGNVVMLQNKDTMVFYACKQWNLTKIQKEKDFLVKDLDRMIATYYTNNFVSPIEWVFNNEEKFYFISPVMA